MSSERRRANLTNCYEDDSRAKAYATLDFAKTYYLAFRDLPGIISAEVNGIRALDFGCGTGRSSRFLRKHGFTVTGIDISDDMLRIARTMDPFGDYRLMPGDDLNQFAAGSFDLVLSAFPFDNIPDGMKAGIFGALAGLLAPGGAIVNIVSSPEIYTHEWASFTTREFPENALARNGDVVRIVTTDHGDRRPVEDILCTDESYRAIYRQAGLEATRVWRPLANGDEPYTWVNETNIPPWVIYVLRRIAHTPNS